MKDCFDGSDPAAPSLAEAFTAAAVKALQLQYGLAVDGEAGPVAAKVLGIAPT
jgi:peptidoglycan hydrolase-like protein with peptidoglycan-binding domain